MEATKDFLASPRLSRLSLIDARYDERADLTQIGGANDQRREDKGPNWRLRQSCFQQLMVE